MKRNAQLTDKEMHAAQLLVDGRNQIQAAKEAGMDHRTLQRRLTKPEFIAYRDQIRARHDKNLSHETEKKLRKLGASFVKADALEMYLEIAALPNTRENAAHRIAAMREAVALCGYDKGPTPSTGSDPDAPPKPDIYRPEWLGKPQ